MRTKVPRSFAVASFGAAFVATLSTLIALNALDASAARIRQHAAGEVRAELIPEIEQLRARIDDLRAQRQAARAELAERPVIEVPAPPAVSPPAPPSSPPVPDAPDVPLPEPPVEPPAPQGLLCALLSVCPEGGSDARTPATEPRRGGAPAADPGEPGDRARPGRGHGRAVGLAGSPDRAHRVHHAKQDAVEAKPEPRGRARGLMR